MKKIITAMNSIKLNEELKKENNIEIPYKNIFYKEGILEILEKDKEINTIIFDYDLPGEIKINNLIEKILKINKNIKLILTIKKENKKKIKINDKKIRIIFYEKEINLKKIINKRENFQKENSKNNNKTKIISIFGDRQVGKTIIALILSTYLKSKNCNILLVELNKESPSFLTIFGIKKNIMNKKVKYKKIKVGYKKVNKKFKCRFINKKVIENMIVKVDEHINLITYNRIIKFKYLKLIKKKYDYLIIENNILKNKVLNKKIINNSYKNILIIKPNLIEIKNNKKIIEKNKLKNKNNFKILINNYNKYSIDENIIKNIFFENKIIGKIKYKSEYEKIINSNSLNQILNIKNNDKNIYNIANQIFK